MPLPFLTFAEEQLSLRRELLDRQQGRDIPTFVPAAFWKLRVGERAESWKEVQQSGGSRDDRTRRRAARNLSDEWNPKAALQGLGLEAPQVAIKSASLHTAPRLGGFVACEELEGPPVQAEFREGCSDLPDAGVQLLD